MSRAISGDMSGTRSRTFKDKKKKNGLNIKVIQETIENDSEEAIQQEIQDFDLKKLQTEIIYQRTQDATQEFGSKLKRHLATIV